MPINVPDGLPAISALESENIFVMSESRAQSQDIRPIQIAVLNLMPTKIETEIQFMRLLSNTPLQVDVTLAVPSTHEPKNTSKDYLSKFYKRFSEIEDSNFDGMIITGAPLENKDYEQIDYWDEMRRIMDWTKSHVTTTVYVCWAALAGLKYLYGVEKIMLPSKKSGIFDDHFAAHSGIAATKKCNPALGKPSLLRMEQTLKSQSSVFFNDNQVCISQTHHQFVIVLILVAKAVGLADHTGTAVADVERIAVLSAGRKMDRHSIPPKKEISLQGAEPCNGFFVRIIVH
ncbi:MAG: homoserine O-succinyltransferase, partial [Candidatus Methanomethylophilaceae archaeon]|nr:homoserine O-succinyltransferase [Candidatus Methanomethylophilaceae archaeon]